MKHFVVCYLIKICDLEKNYCKRYTIIIITLLDLLIFKVLSAMEHWITFHPICVTIIDDKFVKRRVGKVENLDQWKVKGYCKSLIIKLLVLKY